MEEVAWGGHVGWHVAREEQCRGECSGQSWRGRSDEQSPQLLEGDRAAGAPAAAEPTQRWGCPGRFL